MQDVNYHDNQDLLNNRIAHVLADTITGLRNISNEMDVEPNSLYKQFLGSYVLFINTHNK